MSMASKTSRSLICRSALIMWAATPVSDSMSNLSDHFADADVIDSTALLIGEKCAMLVAEDLGYSGKALEMKVGDTNPPPFLCSVKLMNM